MKSTRFLPLCLTNVLFVFASALIQCTTFAASHSWVGGAGPFWNISANWTNGLPSTGDDLYFVAGNISNQSNYNNLVGPVVYGKLTISEGNNIGYTLAGNQITLTNGIAAFGTLQSIQPQIDFIVSLGGNQTWTSSRSLAFNNTVNLNGQVLTMDNSGGVTFNGVLTDPAPITGRTSGYMDKRNSGLIFFSSTSGVSGYGATLVNTEAGTLRFDGYATNGGGSINLPSFKCTSTTVTGTGRIDSMQLSGTLIPGDFAPGILHCDDLQFSGTMVFAINGTNVGSDYSQLSSRDVIFGNKFWQCYPDASPASLNLQLGYTPQLGDTFRLITSAPSGARFFNGLWGNCIVQTNGFAFAMTYDTNGVSLTTMRAPDSPFLLWTGSSNPQYHFFSDTNNWANGTVATNFSRLQFTPYQYHDQAAACADDTASLPVDIDYLGANMASILFTGTNYWITGNNLAVTEGITNRCAGTNKFSCGLNAAPGLTLVVDRGSVLQLDGALNATNVVHKVGFGELLYTGSVSNLYTGPLSLEEGSARVDGSILNGTFEVHNGLLTGTGTIRGLRIFTGTLIPGTATTGIPAPGPVTGVMHVRDNFEMDVGSGLELGLNTPTMGSGYDAVELSGNGTILINGGVLDLQPTNNIPLGSQFTVILNDTTNPVVGTFQNLPEGKAFLARGQYFSITYQGGDGNDVVVTRANPPATFGTISQTASNAVQLSGSGGANLSYTIQATTNLPTTNWINIGTAPADGAGHFSYTDTNLFLYPQRFFRALAP